MADMVLPNALPVFERGAVQGVHQDTLRKHLDRLHGDYPASFEHRSAVRQLGGEFVYAAPLSGKYRGRWFVLVRFGDVLEQKFGLSAEVPTIYDHHADLQMRTVDSLPEYLESLPEDRRSVSPEFCFLWTPDPQTEEKSHRWSRPDRLLIPLPRRGQGDAQALLVTLSKLIFSRDLYSVRGAVTGRDFFGRRLLMSAVLDDIHNARVPGIFGMRKTGKTSLLQEMVRSSMASDARSGRRRAFVYQDLEHLSSFEAGDPVEELVSDLVESLRRGLKAAGLRTKEVADLPPGASLPQLRSALDALLTRFQPGEDLILLLDEVEYLCPPQAERLPGTAVNQKVPQLFGVFRKLVQERGNFGLVLSGLASASVEASELFGRPNPMFSFAKPYYIGPFSEPEGADLLRGVGKQLGIKWSDDAIALAMGESGGSAMLLRELGSAVLHSFSDDRIDHVVVGKSDVVAVLESWRRSVSSSLREVVLHLQRFYADESALVEVLMSSTGDFEDLAYDYPDQVHRLQQLGVIEQVGQTWVPSRILQMGWELASRRGLLSVPGAQPTRRPEHAGRPTELLSTTQQLLSQGEGMRLEFKETATFNAHTGSKDSRLETAAIKTVAGFLNADGGVLVIGVCDDGTPAGLADDYRVASRRGDRDGYENWLITRLTDEIGQPAIASHVAVSFDEVAEHEVCRVEVDPSPQPVYVGRSAEFFVRMGNSTRQCNPRDAMKYMATHWEARQL